MEDDLKRTIGNRIAQLRGKQSQRSLSLELGQSSNYINQVENVYVMPSLDFLQYLCEHFGISLHEFFQREEIPLKQLELRKESETLTNEQISSIIQIAKLFNENNK